MKTFRVWWSPQALDDLKQIYDYIYEQSPKGANTVFDTLLDLGDSLEALPERFPIDLELSNKTHLFRFVPKWNYKIYYKVNHSTDIVTIAKIFSSKQDPEKIEL